MARVLWTFAIGTALSLMAALSGPAHAQSDEVWAITGKLVGKINKEGKEKKAEDVSGIACIQASGFPRKCLIIDDELQAAQFVTLHEGRIEAGASIPLINDKHAGDPLELDGEGVAFHDRYFYVIGSHGRKRSESANPNEDERAKIAARERASSRVIRVEVDPATGRPAGAEPVRISTVLRGLIDSDATLGPLTRVPLNQDGITIEGIAVFKGRLYAGFRGPSGGGALILSADLGAFFDGGAANPKLHTLQLGAGRGVRDLAVYRNTILILAGTTVGEGGTFALYAWDGTSETANRLKELPTYKSKDDGEQVKPEALLALDEDASGLRVLVISDGAKEGEARTERVKL